jgi:hypothetical protein
MQQDQRAHEEAVGRLRAALGAARFRAEWRAGQALSLDEAFSWYVATAPNWFHSILIDNNPPLYYLLLHAWTAAAGTSAIALRVPAALAGSLLTGLIVWAGCRILNREAALWAGLLAALAPIQVYYSQQARGYPLLDALLLLTWVLVWIAFDVNRWSCWVLAALAGVIALYSHYLAVLALAPTALLLLLPSKHGRGLRYGVAAGASLLCFAPWAYWAFVVVDHPAVGTSWIENAWHETSRLLAIPQSLEFFALGGEAGYYPLWMGPFAEIVFPGVLRLLGLAALLFLGAVLLRKTGGEDPRIPDLGVRKAWLAAMLLLPLAALWLISWVRPAYVVGRYDLLAYPAFPLLLGLSLATVRRRHGWWITGLAAAALLIPVLVKLHLYYGVTDSRQAQHMALVLDQEVRQGDVVLFTGLRGLPVLYELDRRGFVWRDGYCRNEVTRRRFYCRMYPRISELTPAATNTERLLGSPETAKAELGDFLPKLDRTAGTLWLVLYGRPEGGKLQIPQADQLLVRELDSAGFEKIEDERSTQFLFLKYRLRPGPRAGKRPAEAD